MKTTPGPWFVDGHNITAVIANEGDLAYPKWKHVCRCDYGYADPEKYFELNKANAKLIAQAPRMLELLNDAFVTLDILTNNGIKIRDYDQKDVKTQIELLIKSLSNG